MISVGTHGQNCLTEDDYSAIALAMQCNRDAVDTALTNDQTALESYNERPWMQGISTAAVTQVQTLSDWTFGNAWNGFTVFTSSSTSATFTRSGMTGLTAGSYPTGWWNIGGYCSYAPTGAVTNFSRRLACIQVSHIVQTDVVYNTIVQTSFESNTGTDSMTLDGMFYLDNSSNYTVLLGFAHRNSGSSIQVNSGARIWANFLGSGVTI